MYVFIYKNIFIYIDSRCECYTVARGVTCPGH